MSKLAAVAAALLLIACSEIPQDANKPFASAEDTKAASPALAALRDEYASACDAKIK